MMKWVAIICGTLVGALYIFYGIYCIRRRETAIGGDGEIYQTFRGRSSIVAAVFIILAGVAFLVISALVIIGTIEL